jgi:hypothetical protein
LIAERLARPSAEFVYLVRHVHPYDNLFSRTSTGLSRTETDTLSLTMRTLDFLLAVPPIPPATGDQGIRAQTSSQRGTEER